MAGIWETSGTRMTQCLLPPSAALASEWTIASSSQV